MDVEGIVRNCIAFKDRLAETHVIYFRTHAECVNIE